MANVNRKNVDHKLVRPRTNRVRRGRLASRPRADDATSGCTAPPLSAAAGELPHAAPPFFPFKTRSVGGSPCGFPAGVCRSQAACRAVLNGSLRWFHRRHGVRIGLPRGRGRLVSGRVPETSGNRMVPNGGRSRAEVLYRKERTWGTPLLGGVAPLLNRHSDVVPTRAGTTLAEWLYPA